LEKIVMAPKIYVPHFLSIASSISIQWPMPELVEILRYRWPHGQANTA